MKSKRGALSALVVGVLLGCGAYAGEPPRGEGQKWSSLTESSPSGAAVDSAGGLTKCLDSDVGVTKMICETPAIASLDMIADRLYQSRLERATSDESRATLTSERVRWLTGRDRCKSPGCLKASYQDWLSALGFKVH